MPKGPNGPKLPADMVGMSVMVAKIAAGEIEDDQKSGRADSGKVGARACADKLLPEKRTKIAKIAAEVRWKK